MFLGEYVHTIDEKGRLTIPARYRNELATGLVVTRGFDRNLIIYPIREWEKLAEQIMAKPVTDRMVRAFRRRMFSGAINPEADRQGRILLPPYLRDFAGLNGEVVVVGSYNFIEVWSAEVWNGVRDDMEQLDDDIETIGI